MILHVYTFDKFIPSFLQFLEKRFDYREHEHIIFGQLDEPAVGPVRGKLAYYALNSLASTAIRALPKLVLEMHRADKIILHNLFSRRITQILFTFPWLLRKCFWIIWGGDLYKYKTANANSRSRTDEFFRRAVIRKMGNLCTYIPGDYDLARQWYGATGAFHECLMYPSNTVPATLENRKNIGTGNILIGNSADPSNNHDLIFAKIAKVDLGNKRLICPLSYGDKQYARAVARMGVDMFGSRFVPLHDFMKTEDYRDLLKSIEVAVFAHDRQQGMGNLISLLNSGATIYISKNTTTYNLMEKLGFSVYRFEELSDLNTMPESEIARNRLISCEAFSEEQLYSHYDQIFRYKEQ